VRWRNNLSLQYFKNSLFECFKLISLSLVVYWPLLLFQIMPIWKWIISTISLTFSSLKYTQREIYSATQWSIPFSHIQATQQPFPLFQFKQNQNWPFWKALKSVYWQIHISCKIYFLIYILFLSHNSRKIL